MTTDVINRDTSATDGVQAFDFSGRPVRVVLRDGEPWWVIKDVCKVLGVQDHAEAAARLDADERGVDSIPTPGGAQKMTVINESGLYNIILLSRKPEAKAFKRWVTHDVLPAIRKTGLYATPETIDRLIADPDLIIRLATELRDSRAEREAQGRQITALTETVSVQGQQIAELRPIETYYTMVLASKDAIPITVIAKDYGKSAEWMNGKIHEMGIQYRSGDVWVLRQKYAPHGYTQTKTYPYIDKAGTPRSAVHTYWTQAGRLFLYDEFKRRGIYPLIEQFNLGNGAER